MMRSTTAMITRESLLRAGWRQAPDGSLDSPNLHRDAGRGLCAPEFERHAQHSDEGTVRDEAGGSGCVVGGGESVPGIAGRFKRITVSIIVLCRRRRDDDNLAGGCKHLRDAIAKTLGVDDGDDRVRWQYGHMETRGKVGTLVRIEIE